MHSIRSIRLCFRFDRFSNLMTSWTVLLVIFRLWVRLTVCWMTRALALQTSTAPSRCQFFGRAFTSGVQSLSRCQLSGGPSCLCSVSVDCVLSLCVGSAKRSKQVVRRYALQWHRLQPTMIWTLMVLQRRLRTLRMPLSQPPAARTLRLLQQFHL